MLNIVIVFLTKRYVCGAREIVQWVGSLAAVPEDSGSIPSTYEAAHSHL